LAKRYQQNSRSTKKNSLAFSPQANYTDLLHFFIFKGPSHNSLDIRPNLEIASDLSWKPPKLHNSQTNWETFRTQIKENLWLNIPLKTAKDIEEAIAVFTNIIQKAAWSTTPDDKPQAKYPEYPWEVKDQIKEKTQKMADELASQR
jgi:hypothetical protein